MLNYGMKYIIQSQHHNNKGTSKDERKFKFNLRCKGVTFLTIEEIAQMHTVTIDTMNVSSFG